VRDTWIAGCDAHRLARQDAARSEHASGALQRPALTLVEQCGDALRRACPAEERMAGLHDQRAIRPDTSAG
jgi:hypothetical protein